MNGTQPGVPMESIVAITAAIAAVLDQPIGSFVVKSIQPERAEVQPAGSFWAKSGLLESHMARRQFGIRTLGR